MSSQLPEYEGLEPDPVFLNSRREFWIILCVWAAAFAWVVPFCRLNGYDASSETIPTIWGIPRWMFLGVGLPWLVADVFTVWFCWKIMKNDDLEPEEPPADNTTAGKEETA